MLDADSVQLCQKGTLSFALKYPNQFRPAGLDMRLTRMSLRQQLLNLEQELWSMLPNRLFLSCMARSLNVEQQTVQPKSSNRDDWTICRA